MANMVKSEQSIGYYERKNNGMNSISIAIYHTDEVYARALARGISSRWKQAAISVVRLENRAEWEGCDIVLFDEAYAFKLTADGGPVCDPPDRQSDGANGPAPIDISVSSQLKTDDAPAPTCISISKQPVPNDAEIASVYRFTPLPELIAKLKILAGWGTGHLPAEVDLSGVTFWGVTSGAGGSGTSSLAVVLGRSLARIRQQNVMLIEFGRFASDEGVPDIGEGARFFYRVMADEPMVPGLFDVCTHTDSYGLKRFRRAGCENPLWAAGEDENFRLLRFVAQYAGCSHIVLDIPPSTRQSRTLMRVCEHQIVNYGWQHHRFAESAALERALRQVCERDGLDPERIIVSFQPMEDPYSFQGSEVDIHGQFGAEVRALVDRMERP
jgi:hypothetical protein